LCPHERGVMATGDEILSKLNGMLGGISATLDAVGASKLITLDRTTGADAALVKLREGGNDRFRWGLPSGENDFVIQYSPDGSPLSFADRFRIDGTTGLVTVAGLALDAPSFNDTTLTGQSLFDAGSGLAPALAAVGDVDTGLFFPTADAIAGAAAGLEVWRTTAAGIGIGTTLVEARLHVRATSNSPTNYPLRLENSANTLDIGFGAYGLSNKVGSSQTSDFNFEVGGNLYLSAAGVRLPGGASFVVEETDSALTALRLVSDTNEGFLQVFVDGTQTIQLRGQGDNYINSGQLGLGTTAPATALHVKRAGGIIRLEDTASGVAATPALQFYSADGLLAGFGLLSGSNNDVDLFTDAGNLDIWAGGLQHLRLTTAGQFLIGTTVAGASKLVVNDDCIQINNSKTPSSASDTGTTGQIAWDGSYLYVCTATDTWARAALATW
jgi:hypothetical protein